MKTLLLLLLRFYKYAISPMLGQNCRFYPSCSEYAAEAIQLHGAAKGSWLAGKRLCKCHPWHPGGVDLVPATGEKKANAPISVQCCPAHAEQTDSKGHSSHLS
ncbi:MAG: membrane protein insertion efficiency factor YidD [Undibacterium curvum]|uniref:membrane protein insertion efficiency factor YidD n=1 Tax=Undibacterium curvum TaxID=2762294 RepID=UPI003BE7300E